MTEYRSVLERAGESAPSPDLPLERVLQRRDRRHRDQRIRAAVLGIAIAIAVGWLGVNAIRSTPQPADDRSEKFGIFAPVAGRILFEDDRGVRAVDPNGPVDTTPGPQVADDIASTLVPLDLKGGKPLGWSSDGTELLLERSGGDPLLPQSSFYILHADGSETRLNKDPMSVPEFPAAISPDGSRVVYSANGLWVVDADGGHPVRISLEGEAPTFSPDGTQVAYLLEGQVWVVDMDGSHAHQIHAFDENGRFGAGVTGLQWSPAGGRIALGLGAAKTSDALAIYTFAPDGSDFTRVITGGQSPFWSPDGTQIAYTILCEEQPTASCPDGSILRSQYEAQPRSFGGGAAGLAIADADGSNVREFGYGTSGPWHPGDSAPRDETTLGDSFARANGEVLSFTGKPLGPGDLVAVNPETGEERVLLGDLDAVHSAKWSADGAWVAYEVRGQNGIELWVVSDSREPRRLADGASMLSWSPTAAELATIRLTSALDTNIAGSTLGTVDVVSGETTDAGSIPGDIGDVTSAPAWSPDGSRFVFGARGGAIYENDVRAGTTSLLVQLPGQDLDSVDQVAWSPDGAHIAFKVDRGGVYVTDADGSNVRLLGGSSEPGVAWSPDGTRLAFMDDAGSVRLARMDGSATTEIGSPLPLSNPETCALFCQEDMTWSPDGSRIGFRTGLDGSFEASAIDADGRGKAEPIDVITFANWAGGSYEEA